MAYDSKLPGPDEAQVSAPSVLEDLASIKILLAAFTPEN